MSFKIFEEESFFEVSRNNENKAIDYINNQKDDYLLNVNENNFNKYVFNMFSFDLINIHFDEAYITKPKEDYNPNFHVFVVSGNEEEKKDVLWYVLPFEGSVELLKCKPRTCSLFFRKCNVVGQEIRFEIINGDSNYINSEINKINQIDRNMSGLNEEVEVYNRNLKYTIENFIKEKKSQILNKQNDLKNIKVPFKTNNNNKTYQVNPVIIKDKPHIQDHIILENEINPTIDNTLYQNILEVIQNKCKTFELTETFNKFDEEGLRDLIVSDLSTQFDVSTTGESFNKKGKTDILMKYKNNNLFIAECKFWRGIKKFHETIDQILRYITWRDTKTAIVLFVDRKNISNVLKEIENKISEHPNYIKRVNNKKEWLEYEFHIDSDKNIEFKLAFIISHIPKN